MEAIVVDPQSPQRLGFRTVGPPTPRATEALIRVKSISLNRGELVYRVQGEAGTRLGWDLAGVVDQPAAEGPGRREGPGWSVWCPPAPGLSRWRSPRTLWRSLSRP